MWSDLPVIIFGFAAEMFGMCGNSTDVTEIITLLRIADVTYLAHKTYFELETVSENGHVTGGITFLRKFVWPLLLPRLTGFW